MKFIQSINKQTEVQSVLKKECLLLLICNFSSLLQLPYNDFGLLEYAQ